jgi:hypothetical protein
MLPEIQMISPPVYVFDLSDRAYTVFGWLVTGSNTTDATIVPIVANPDGSGIGPWTLYYGEDVWRAS